MKNIKIAFIINTIKKNGPGNVILNLIKHLPKEKYDITLITLFLGNDSSIVINLRNHNINVIERNQTCKLKYLIIGNKDIEGVLCKYQFDIIHTHGFIPDFVCSNSKDRTKKVATIHCNIYEDYKSTYGLFKGLVYSFLHVYALRKYDSCVCCSQSVEQSIHQKLKNTTSVLNGIDVNLDLQNDISRDSYHIPEDAIVFIYVGVLSERKQVPLLIEQFVNSHKDNEFLFILGDGKDYEKCKEKCDSHVLMLGFQKNPIRFLTIADIYVSCSKSEGFSISVIEALSCGLGLFLFDIPSHREVFEINKELYLGELFSKDNFNSKLEKIRKNYGKINSSNITQFQTNLLSAAHMTDLYMKHYSLLLGDNL